MSTERHTRILGIDPGTRHVGYALVEERGSQMIRLASGCLHTRAKDLPSRLVEIQKGLLTVIQTHRPTLAAIETVFGGENLRTAITIGEARGVATVTAASAGLEVVGYEPALVKKAITGNGRAGKEQVLRMVCALLGLSDPPATDHEADAIALACTHLRRSHQLASLGPEAATIQARRNSRRRPAIPPHLKDRIDLS